MKGTWFSFWLVLLIAEIQGVEKEGKSLEEEKYGVKYANKCEVCKILTNELSSVLEETGKSGDVIETAYHLDRREENKKEYKTSQLRLIESLEKVCENILSYSIHKERTDSTRFAKGQSQTFSTLHGLVNKGVKVDLGIPYELWDKPSAEITQLKAQCEDMLENYESEIEDWYNGNQNIPLRDYLCRDTVLKTDDKSCLYEKAEISMKDKVKDHPDASLKTEL